MKKSRSFLYIGAAALALLFVAVSVFTFFRSQSLIEKGYLASEGSAAENFAVLTGESIRLTDAQVARLRNCTYEELLESKENRALTSLMSNRSFSMKVDYAYVMVHLPENEVLYTVTEESKDRFDAPVGTKLDIMWLLDVNVSEAATGNPQNAVSDELTRYSYYIEEDAQIFGNAPSYVFYSSEWGDHICGYAPLYSVEGTYIGVIGVELQTGDFQKYCSQAVWAMGVLLTVSVLMLTVLFLYIYTRYRKLQYEKIYTDSLTGVYNRSYYNSQFIRRLGARRSGGKFALLIADADWFKKVNDTFGHDVGDEVLVELGGLMQEVFGREQVVRFGGEEFVAGFWLKDESEIREKLDLLFGKIAAHLFSSRQIQVSISLGCAWCETDTLNGWLLSGMLRAADCKLYEAKESGRKRYLIEGYDSKKTYQKAGKNAGEAVK